MYDFAELQWRIESLRSFMDVSRSTCGTITEVLDGVDEVLSEVSTDFAPFMNRSRRLRRLYHNSERAILETDSALEKYELANKQEDYLTRELPNTYKRREEYLAVLCQLVDAIDYLNTSASEQQTAKQASAKSKTVLSKAIALLLDDFRYSLSCLDWADWNDFETTTKNKGSAALELIIDSMDVDVISASLESIYTTNVASRRSWLRRIVETLTYVDERVGSGSKASDSGGHGAAERDGHGGHGSTQYADKCKDIFCEVREQLFQSILKEGFMEVGNSNDGTYDAEHLTLLWGLKIKIAAAAMRHERKLCNDLFRRPEDRNSVFAVVVGKTIVILLNYARLIIEKLQDSKRLFIILKMHKSLMNAMPALLKTLEVGDIGFFGETVLKLKDIIYLLADSTKNAFRDIELLIRSNVCGSSFNKRILKDCPEDGSVHFLPSEVVNFLRKLLKYPNAVDIIFSETSRNIEGGRSAGGGDVSMDSLISRGLGNLEEETTASDARSKARMQLGSNIIHIVIVLHDTLERKASVQFQNDQDLFNLFMVNNLHYVYWALHRIQLRHIMGREWFENQSKVIDTYIIEFLTGWFAVADVLDEASALLPRAEVVTADPFASPKASQSPRVSGGSPRSLRASDVYDDPSQPISQRLRKAVSKIRKRNSYSRRKSSLSNATGPSTPFSESAPGTPISTGSNEQSATTPHTPGSGTASASQATKLVSRLKSLRAPSTTNANGQDRKLRLKVKEVSKKFSASFHELHERQSGYIIGDPDLRLKLQEIIQHIVCRRYRVFLSDVAAYDGSRIKDFFHNADEKPTSKSLSKYIEFDESYLDTMIMQLFHV